MCDWPRGGRCLPGRFEGTWGGTSPHLVRRRDLRDTPFRAGPPIPVLSQRTARPWGRGGGRAGVWGDAAPGRCVCGGRPGRVQVCGSRVILPPRQVTSPARRPLPGARPARSARGGQGSETQRRERDRETPSLAASCPVTSRCSRFPPARDRLPLPSFPPQPRKSRCLKLPLYTWEFAFKYSSLGFEDAFLPSGRRRWGGAGRDYFFVSQKMFLEEGFVVSGSWGGGGGGAC